MQIKDINIEGFNYELPDSRIAKYPLENRSNSKLLIYDKGNIKQKFFKDISKVLENDFLVYNNTKVIQARLNFKKKTGANIEIFCLEPIEPADYSLMFQSVNSCKWKCIIGNLKKWKIEEVFSTVIIYGIKITVSAKKIRALANSNIIEFSWDNSEISFGEILENMGQTPIPPYLKRKSEESDKERYQTVYSKHKGSVAAPTAGLHFTDEILKDLFNKGITTGHISLHVGAGTFKPVKTNKIGEHEMHAEHFSVSKKLILQLIKNDGKIVAVGTTTVRTLESLYVLGCKLNNKNNLESFNIKQWEVYDIEKRLSSKDSLNNILSYMNENNLETINASTKIIIVPGYKFKIVNKLITNFHQPKSTLLLLISAFIGEDWKDIYKYAFDNDFRFLSYGDSSLLIPK